MRSSVLRLGALVALLALDACRTLPPPPLAASAPWEQRRPQLQALQHFQLKGRIALSAAGNGFNANLRWQQQDERYPTALESPLGVGGTQITAHGDDLEIVNAHGGHIGNDAARASCGRASVPTCPCRTCDTGGWTYPIRPLLPRSSWMRSSASQV
jgi:outer membrane biogenesis lipoprotein LolB